MPRRSPYEVRLTDHDRLLLHAVARTYTLPYRDVIRAKIVLMAADGMGNDEIARRLDTSREVVGKWRKRYAQEGLQGLRERDRVGRPRTAAPS